MGVFMLQSFAKSFHLLLSSPRQATAETGGDYVWAFCILHFVYIALGVRPLAGEKHEDASGNQG